MDKLSVLFFSLFLTISCGGGGGANESSEELALDCKQGTGKGRIFYLYANKKTGKGNVTNVGLHDVLYSFEADVSFTADKATWRYDDGGTGYLATYTINRESLKVYYPDGPGYWGQCEIQKENPKNQF